tara:strand:- start:19141 stop:19986 length:846 start_codon:yes stop_codon:yes gene_type:complete
MSNKPFLIAEIGINHNGDINIAKKLIENSKLSNFDAVKFQKRDINSVYTKEFLDGPRNSPWGETQRDQKEGLEFSEINYSEIDKYCKDLDIQWFSSAWDLKSLSFLDKFNTKYNKIASAMIVDLNFLSEVAKRGKHTFISTGMSELKNIDEAVNIFKKHNCSFELMHCISIYPLDPKDVHLRTMKSLKKRYDCDVGYSGHENGITISLAAVVLGASSIERHITLDRTMYGSDQAASIELSGMKNLTEQIDKYLLAYGQDMIGKVLEDEVPIAKKLREHLKI